MLFRVKTLDFVCDSASKEALPVFVLIQLTTLDEQTTDCILYLGYLKNIYSEPQNSRLSGP